MSLVTQGYAYKIGGGGSGISISLLDVLTEYTSYKINDEIIVNGAVRTSTNIANLSVNVYIKKQSNDDIIETLLNTIVSFTANATKTLTEIAGEQLIFVPNEFNEYYADVIVSGGTPLIDPSKTDTETRFGFCVEPVRILQLDVSTDNVFYSPSDTINISGVIKVDTNVIGANVLLEVRLISDDFLVDTLMDTTTDFFANFEKSLTTINGDIPVTWTTDEEDSYYLKLTISGGDPDINADYSDNTVSYGFVVSSLINQVSINYPISIDVLSKDLIVDIVQPKNLIVDIVMLDLAIDIQVPNNNLIVEVGVPDRAVDIQI